MNKSLLAFGLAIVLIACGSGNRPKEFSTAVAYDNYITSRITQMQQSLFAVQNGKFDSTQIKPAITRYEKQIDSVNKTIKNMPAFDGNKAYRDAAINLGEFYKKSVGTYYADIAEIYRDVKDSTAEPKVTELITKLQNEETKADARFLTEREAFGAKHKLNLLNKE